MPRRFLIGASLFLGLIAAASAQTTLLSFGFEGDTAGNVATGWLSSSSFFKVAANPSQSGINTSTKVVTWTGADSTDSALISLTGYTSGYTFNLSFDLYDPDSTDTHGVLVGYGVSGSNSDAWVIGPSGANMNAGQSMNNDLTAAATWQHFSYDFTSSVNSYLTNRPTQAAVFGIFFDQWSNGTGSRASVDNIVFTATAVPEPSTNAALAGAAALGFAALRRRRTS